MSNNKTHYHNMNNMNQKTLLKTTNSLGSGSFTEKSIENSLDSEYKQKNQQPQVFKSITAKQYDFTEEIAGLTSGGNHVISSEGLSPKARNNNERSIGSKKNSMSIDFNHNLSSKKKRNNIVNGVGNVIKVKVSTYN